MNLSIKLISFFLIFISSVNAQIPRPALVGYWENWGNVTFDRLHENYNVIQLAFATTVGSSLFEMTFSTGPYKSDAEFEAGLDLLHTQGKKVILSIGGANDPIFLANETEKNTFVSTMKAILDRFNYKIDGIDIDIESTSFAFGEWTVDQPAPGQLNMIAAIEELMQYHKEKTGNHFLLTMAPETVYIIGGLSTTQTSNYNGGALIPILEALKDSIDLLHPQFYNAYESTAINGRNFRNDGSPNYMVAIVESIVLPWEIKNSKGSYTGFPAEKLAIGLPASACDQYSEGWVEPSDVVAAVQYLRGEISKPDNVGYALKGSYPELAGLMTWSMNEDYKNANCWDEVNSVLHNRWEFAENFPLVFPEALTSIGELNKITPNFSVLQDGKKLFINSIEEESFQLYNLSGQLVQTLVINKSNDLTAVSSGNYYLYQTSTGVQRSIHLLD